MMNIVIIPFHDVKKWIQEGYRTRDAHLAQHFAMNAQVNKILIINRPVSLAETLYKRHGWKTKDVNVVYKEKNFQISNIDSKTYCLDIFVPDFFSVLVQKKGWWFSAFENKEIIFIINKTLKYLNISKYTLFLENPMAIGAVEYLHYDKFVFDAIDNWLYHPQMEKYSDIIKRNYMLINNKADVIVTVSEALKQMFNNRDNVYWIPNGVDVNYFSNGLKEIGNHVNIGYVGKIQERVDFDLVEKCLELYPDYIFSFAGPIYAQKQKINKLKLKYKNFVILGDIHYSKLPTFLKTIDIAIIPHKVDSFTQSMNPLKVYEYLAAGKPVITTDIAGVSNISKYIYISKNYQEFTNNIKKVLELIRKKPSIIYEICDDIPLRYQWNNISNEILSLF